MFSFPLLDTPGDDHLYASDIYSREHAV